MSAIHRRPVGGEIFGTVYDGNQNPATQAVVTAVGEQSGNSYTATTDDNGMYMMSPLPLDTYDVTAILSDGTTNAGETTGTLADVSTPVEIDIGLQNYGNVSGNVTDVNGNPYPNVNILVTSSADNYSSGSSTDGNGNYYFGNIDQGTITVQVLDNNNVVQGTATGVLPYGGKRHHQRADHQCSLASPRPQAVFSTARNHSGLSGTGKAAHERGTNSLA